MESPNYPEQKARLEELLGMTHLTPEQLAERVSIKLETFTKYLKGVVGYFDFHSFY